MRIDVIGKAIGASFHWGIVLEGFVIRRLLAVALRFYRLTAVRHKERPKKALTDFSLDVCDFPHVDEMSVEPLECFVTLDFAGTRNKV